MDQANNPDVLFHPAGCDPFPNPSFPSTTFYHPSNATQQRFDSSKIVLTPEKRKKFNIKDNESYTPLNYSFTAAEEIEEEDRKVDIKEVEESSHSDSFPSMLYSEASYSETLDSNISQEDLRAVSKTTKTPSVASSSLYDKNTVTVRRSLASLPPKTPTPEMSSTQSSSNPSSNVSVLLNRFRYGKPKPRSERKPPNKPSPVFSKPPLSTDHKKYDWKAEETEKSSLDYTESMKRSELENGKSEEDSFSEFEKRVNEVLQRGVPSPLKVPGSRPDANTPSSTQQTPTSSRSTVYPTPQVSPPEKQLRNDRPIMPGGKTHVSFHDQERLNFQHQPIDPSSSTSSEFDSDDILQQWRLRRKIEEARNQPNLLSHPGYISQHQSEKYIPAERPFSHETPPHPQQLPCAGSTFQQPHVGGAPTQQPVGTDLQNQQVCPDVTKQPVFHGLAIQNFGYPGASSQYPVCPGMVGQQPYYPGYHQPYFPCPMRQPPCPEPTSAAPHISPQTVPTLLEESQQVSRESTHPHPGPVPQTKTRASVAIGTVDTTCAETQTTPKSSRSSSTLLSDLETRDSPIAMQRVTIVDAKKKSSKAAVSPTSTLSSSASRTKSRKGKTKSKKHEQSPTTTIVKKVIGSRLFDESQTSSPHKHDTTNGSIARSDSTVTTDNESKPYQRRHLSGETSATRDDKCSETSAFGTSGWSEKSSSEESQKTGDLGNPQDVLKQLLESIEIEELDFEDDPVLNSLRSQRENLLSQLRSVEMQLEEDG